MRLESREARTLLLIPETEDESAMIDRILGSTVAADGLIAEVQGEVRLSGGYGPHYIALSKM